MSSGQLTAPIDPPVIEPGLSTASQWRAALAWLGLGIVGLLLVYAPTLLAMVHIWTYNKSYAHCFFVPPLVAYLIWMNRERLAQIAPTPSAWGAAATVASGAAWFLAHMAAVQVGEHFALAAMVVGMFWAVLGERAVRAAALPIALLFLVVPFGEGMFPALISIAGKLGVAWLRATGTPVGYDGIYIRLVNGEWRITEACSGLRYILSVLTVGLVFAYTTYTRWWKRVAFLVACVAAAVMMNGFRIWIIVLIGIYSDMKSPLVRDHVSVGWVLFAIMLVLLFFLGRRFADPVPVESRPLPPERRSERRRGIGRSAWTVAVVTLALSAGWSVLAGALDRVSINRPVTLASPATTGAWRPLEMVPWDWAPHYDGAKAVVHQVYEGPSGTVALYTAYFRDQRQGAELVRIQNGLPTPGDPIWRYTPETPRTLPEPALTVGETDVRSPSLGFRAWRWYWTGRRYTSNANGVKIDGLASKLSGNGDDAAVIVVYAPFEEDPGQASAVMTGFLREMKPGIDRMIQEAARP